MRKLSKQMCAYTYMYIKVLPRSQIRALYFATAAEMSHSNSQALGSILEIRQTADVLHARISTSKQMLLGSELVYRLNFLIISHPERGQDRR